jgi:hypothetical protein
MANIPTAMQQLQLYPVEYCAYAEAVDIAVTAISPVPLMKLL